MRDPLAVERGGEVRAHLEPLQLRPREGGDRVALAAGEDPGRVGRAGGGVVVERERHAVGGELDVQLEEVRVGRTGLPECGHSVLGGGSGSAAVADQHGSVCGPGRAGHGGSRTVNGAAEQASARWGRRSGPAGAGAGWGVEQDTVRWPFGGICRGACEQTVAYPNGSPFVRSRATRTSAEARTGSCSGSTSSASAAAPSGRPAIRN